LQISSATQIKRDANPAQQANKVNFMGKNKINVTKINKVKAQTQKDLKTPKPNTKTAINTKNLQSLIAQNIRETSIKPAPKNLTCFTEESASLASSRMNSNYNQFLYNFNQDLKKRINNKLGKVEKPQQDYSLKLKN